MDSHKDTKAQRERADALLRSIGDLTRTLEGHRARHEAALAAVDAEYAPQIQTLEKRIGAAAKDLAGLMKEETAAVFGGADIVRLANGLLTHTTEEKVSIPRDALEKIKAQGWVDAIRVVESVNRAVVERWPTERLTVIGARKRLAHGFGYEIKANV